MSPEELARHIVKAVYQLAENGDPDSIKTLEVLFNILEDDQRV